MLIEEAQGQQTIQALFMQTGPKEEAVILNCRFERNGEDGKLYYVFAGTADHYMMFRELMRDYAVFPAHEVEGHPSNPATQAAAAQEAGEAAPVVDTAPNETKSTADTGETPPELSVTDGIVVTPEGAADDASVHSPEQPANGGQSASGDAGATGANDGRGVDVHGGADDGRPGTADRSAGGEAAAPNASGTVDPQVTAPAAKPDPFADL